MDTNTTANINIDCVEHQACPIIDECVICYEPVCEHDVLEPCRHRMHRHCFLKTENDLCPVCRQRVKIPPKPISRTERNFITTIQFVAIVITLCCFYATLAIIKSWKLV